MKKMNSFSIMLLFTVSSLFITETSLGQTWSTQQKEVWTNVETYWSVQAKGDLDGFLSYFSSDYMGWSYNSPVPQGKESTSKYVSLMMKNRKTLFYDLTPVAILIHTDIAIVDYYYTMQVEFADGKKQWKSGRWTDILKKQTTGATAKWVLIADHGGENKDDK